MTPQLDSLACALTGAGIECVEEAPLAPFTTFHIGGPAALLARPRTTAQAAACLRLATIHSVPFLVLGAGSNVLIADEGYPYLVLSTLGLDRIGGHGRVLACGAGAAVPDVAEEAARRGLTGMERICAVPGTVGGGVYMNAGCEGLSLGDLLTRVTWVEPDGRVVSRPRAEVDLGYRDSEFQGTARLITGVELTLRPADDRTAITQAMETVRRVRAAKFPLDFPNCGSVFKRVDPQTARPWVDREGKAAYSAGYYLERVGLKGARRGEAQISDRHANFIINLGAATAADVLALIDLARTKVKREFGFELHLELKVIDVHGRKDEDPATQASDT